MPYFQTLVVHVSVATALALFSAATEVKATEYQCNCDEFEKRLKEMSEQVSDLVKKTYDCSMLELSIATLPQDIKKLTADVKALQNRGQNTVSNLIHPVPRMSIDAVYKKVRELDEKLREMESERKSLRDAVGRMERDIQSERLERNSITDAVRAEVKNVTKLLAPEVQRTAAALPSMVAEMKRFYSAGRVIMRLLSPAGSLNETANKNKFERNSIAVPEGETDETTTESHAEIHAADAPSHSTQQKFEMNANFQENLYNGTALTIHSDVAKSHSHGQPNFTGTALYSEALKNDRFHNVSEIEFVGQDTNFSISIRDSKVTDCMEYDSNNDNISKYNAVPCDGFRADVDFEGHRAEERMAPVSDDFTTHTWSMEKVIMVMAEELQKLRKKNDDDALSKRVEQIEKNVDRMITNMTKLERPIKDEIEERFTNISLRIKDTVEVLAEYNLTHLEDTIEELARNTSSIWQSLHNALNKMQQVQRDLSEDINNSNVGNNASFHSMKENLLLSVSQLSELNESLQRSLAERETVLKGELEKLNSEIELKVSQLSQTVQRVLVSLDELSESYNSSIVSTDIKLQARMDDLHQRVFNEIERLKGIMKKNAESPGHLPTLSGWHPDDAADCPGLDVLGHDDRLVLSTHNSGRYRAPNLPSDPLPVGSVVRFRCVPAGSHRLIGAAELHCLGAKRWSSKPPRCQPLLTLEQIMVGNSTNMTPSILYDGLVDDEWASSDDNGSLVVRPGANVRLKCLYPRKRGNVTWLHNGTFPRDAALAWVKEGPADLGENAYMLEINRTSSEHSGTYRCDTPEGRKNSIAIKILEVTCQGPAAPENGHVEMASPGQAPVGSKARFHCSLGYGLQGSNETTCLGSGYWSDLSQKCKKMDHFSLPEGSCLRPVVPDGLSVSPDKDWYETGTRIRYSCQGGKLLLGMPTATCHEGQWMGQNRRCQ